MDKCQRILWLAVFAMLMSAISGFFIPFHQDEQQMKLGLANTPLGLLLRQARGVDGNSQDPNPCASFQLCVRTSSQLQLSFRLLHFQFDEMVNGLSSWCNEATVCDQGQCNDATTIRHNEIINSIFNHGCESASRFEQGAACWGGQFKSRMNGCSANHWPNGPFTDRVRQQLLACYAAVTEDLATCSQQDVRFVANITTTLTQSGV